MCGAAQGATKSGAARIFEDWINQKKSEVVTDMNYYRYMISTDLRERQWRYAMKRKERKEAKKTQTKAQDRLSRRDTHEKQTENPNTNPSPNSEGGEKEKEKEKDKDKDNNGDSDSSSEDGASVYREKVIDGDKDMVTDQTEERVYQKELKKGPKIIRNLDDVERERRRMRKEGRTEAEIKEYLGSAERQYEDEVFKNCEFSDLSSDEYVGDNEEGQDDRQKKDNDQNKEKSSQKMAVDNEPEIDTGDKNPPTPVPTPVPASAPNTATPPNTANQCSKKSTSAAVPWTVDASPLAPANQNTNRSEMTPVDPRTLAPPKKNTKPHKETDNTNYTDHYIVYDLLCENLPKDKKSSKNGQFSLYDRIDNYNEKTDLTKCSMCDQIIPFYKVGNTIEIVVMTGMLNNMKEEAKVNPANCRHFETVEIDTKMTDIKTYLEPILNTLKMMLSVNILMAVGDNDLIDDYDNLESLKNDLLDMVGTLMTPCTELEKENRGRPFQLKMVELPFFPIISKIGNDTHTPITDKTEDICKFNAFLKAINSEGVPNYTEIVPSLKKEGITVETFEDKPALNSHIIGEWKGKDTLDKKRHIKAHVKKRFWEKVHRYFRQVAMLSDTNR